MVLPLGTSPRNEAWAFPCNCHNKYLEPERK